jgi:large subunit ribosomal protein L21
VDATPTENPAPANEAQANPPAQSTDAPAKAAKNKPADKPTAKTPSTKNAAPAKGAAKKAPKGK